MNTPDSKERVALIVQYVGTNFHGWQRQPRHRSVQETIESALQSILGHPVTLHGAGRTDSGVHAAAQVAHFDHGSSIPGNKWSKVLNSLLPIDVVITASETVKYPWHARFSAIWRRYRYTFYTDPQPNLFISPFTWHYYHDPLDTSLMGAALTPLKGKHHLSAFHRANSSRQHSWVDVQAVECYRNGPFVIVEIQANGFLYGMVRLLVGMLVEVGRGQRSIANFTDIWTNERREEVKYAAPPQGLCLLRVGYPDFPFPDSVWFDTQPLFNFRPALKQT